MEARPRLWITTPSIRPDNLPLLEADPELQRAPEFFDVRWKVLPDCFSMGCPWPCERVHFAPSLPWCDVENTWVQRQDGQRKHGEDLYNSFADRMDPDIWWMGIADDSLPVPGVFEALRRAADEGADVVVMPMSIPGVVNCLARPSEMRPCQVSGGQVFHRRGAMGDLRWKVGDPTLDGIFVQDLWQATNATKKWIFLDGPEIRHNQLRELVKPGGLA